MQLALLIFCLLTIVGAFSAWRQSPLYSLKTTMKLVGSFLLIAVVVAGTSMAIVNGPPNRSPIVEGVAGFLAMLVLGSSASIFIVRITDAHVAQLPPSAKLVTFNRHKVYRWIWRLVVFLLICTVASLVLPSSWNWLPIGLGGFLLLACGPMLSISYMMARRNDRGMSAVIADPWAHWQYTPEQWEQWAKNQQEWEEAQEGPWRWKNAALFVLFCGGTLRAGLYILGRWLAAKRGHRKRSDGLYNSAGTAGLLVQTHQLRPPLSAIAGGCAGSMVRRRGPVLQRGIHALDTLRQVPTESHRCNRPSGARDVYLSIL